MRSRDITIGRGANKVVFNFICDSKSTRNGFAHECELRVNGLYFYNKINYYNRAWEAYTFQSVMKGTLALYQSHAEAVIRQRLLAKEGKQRLTPTLKKEWEKECKANKNLKVIAECKEILNGRYYE